MRPRVELFLIVIAAVVALSPAPTPWIEHRYSSGSYLVVQNVLTPLSNLIPWALLDLLIVAAAAVVVLLVRKAVVRARMGRLRALWRFACDAASALAVVYLMFVAVWGLNYRRQPLTQKLDFNPARVSAATVGRLARDAVDRLNALHGSAHASAWPTWDDLPTMLTPSFARAQHALGMTRRAIPGVPKRSVIDAYFRQAAVDGMIDPFFLEVLINHSVLPFERPFVLAHEWGHLAGYADESEASFVGWIACQHAGEQGQYSAWLTLYQDLSEVLDADVWRQTTARLDAGPRADLRAVIARVRRAPPIVRRVTREAYDRFLKANRVEAGIRSYEGVVALVAGTRFHNARVPRLRD